MAEEVIIQGFGNGNEMPDFATEATQKQVLNALKAAGLGGLDSSDMDKLINAISTGDGDVVNTLKKIQSTNSQSSDTLDKLKDANKKLENAIKKGDKTAIKESNETQKILSEFSGLMGGIRDGLKSGELGLGDAISTVGAGLQALTGPAGKLGGAIIGLATAVNGANQFMIGIGEDRFNLANEIRQSGLATSLTTAESSMISFSEMVNKTSFTLGQAAEFANKFSMAVGGAGIERSMQFVEDMAYGGAEGADMMRRFGLEFGGVANVAGQYLETVRNLGMLDRMNNQQLRVGMEDFMNTVTVTSNIMKINIQDAAEMISQTLAQRDDLTVMLAGLPTELRGTVDSAVAAFGGQGNQFAESIAQYVASGGMQGFVQTEQGAALQGSAFGQEFLPLLQRIGDQILSGGDLGQIIASSQGEIGRITGLLQDSGFRAQALQGQDQVLTQLGAAMLRLQDTIGDAGAGNRANTNAAGLEDDRTFVDRLMVQQEMVLAQENLLTQIGKAADFAENLAQRNADNLALINSVEEAGAQLIGSMGKTVADITFGTESAFTRFTTYLADAGTGLLSFVSEDMAIARELIQEQNRRAQEMLGIDPDTIEQRSRQVQQEKADEIRQRNIERTVGDNGAGFGLNPMRQEFDEDIVAAALNLGNEIIDYDIKDDAGNVVRTEKRISTNITGMGGPTYMPITDAEFRRIDGERTARNTMLERAENNDLISDRFADRLLRGLTQGDLERNATQIAELLGANDTSRTFDLSSEQSQAEIKFFDDALKELQNTGGLTREDVDRLIAAMDGIDTTGFLRRESTEQREANEVNALVTELRRLVSALEQ